MKKLLFAFCLFMPSTALAQSFEEFDACKQLKVEVMNAVEEAKPIQNLMTNDAIGEETYLEQLYQAVQILTKSGESFFKASDAYESTCQTTLVQANKLGEMQVVYTWYVEPVKEAYQFFARAKTQAIRLGRQKDVETFVKSMREYEDSIMKIAANCESVLAGTAQAVSCRQLTSKLEDAVK